MPSLYKRDGGTLLLTEEGGVLAIDTNCCCVPCDCPNPLEDSGVSMRGTIGGLIDWPSDKDQISPCDPAGGYTIGRQSNLNGSYDAVVSPLDISEGAAWLGTLGSPIDKGRLVVEFYDGADVLGQCSYCYLIRFSYLCSVFSLCEAPLSQGRVSATCYMQRFLGNTFLGTESRLYIPQASSSSGAGGESACTLITGCPDHTNDPPNHFAFWDDCHNTASVDYEAFVTVTVGMRG